jgi:hypothetical protein
MKQQRKEENPLLPAIPLDMRNKVRQYYIYNPDHINKTECVTQGRASIQKGDYKYVEVHKHGAGTMCPGMHLKDLDDKCFRIGKGIK